MISLSTHLAATAAQRRVNALTLTAESFYAIPNCRAVCSDSWPLTYFRRNSRSIRSYCSIWRGEAAPAAIRRCKAAASPMRQLGRTRFAAGIAALRARDSGSLFSDFGDGSVIISLRPCVRWFRGARQPGRAGAVCPLSFALSARAAAGPFLLTLHYATKRVFCYYAVRRNLGMRA